MIGLASPSRPVVAGALVAGLWLAAAVLGLLAVSSLAGVRAGFVVNMAQTLTPLMLFGAILILATAIGTRRWVLAGVALAVVASHLVLLLPVVRPRPPSGNTTSAVTASGAAALRVFSANLRFGNPDVRPIAREAMESGADVIALQELTDVHLEAMRAEGVLDAYPHAVVDARSGAFGSAILSTLPLAEARVEELAGLPMSRAIVTFDGRPVELVNVHTLSPMSSDNFDVRDRQLAALADLATRSEGKAVVLVGDFNANRWHPAFRRLLDSGLGDAHEQVGRGLARTWPNGTKLPTFALLDHVLVSPPITAVSVREGTGRGSDHRPVVADLALP